MPKKQILIQGIGSVTLTKRRGSRNLRLSISANGDIRVSMPTWLPYQAGIGFAKSNSGWIERHLKANKPTLIVDGAQVGKHHRVLFVKSKGGRIVSKISEDRIIIYSPHPYDDALTQSSAKVACEKALKAEAEDYLLPRLNELAMTHSYSYRKSRIKRLSSRWGSCSSHNDITLNSYLMQLDDRLIDYVILHELVHTRHKHHQKEFWDELKSIYPSAIIYRKRLKASQPRLIIN